MYDSLVYIKKIKKLSRVATACVWMLGADKAHATLGLSSYNAFSSNFKHHSPSSCSLRYSPSVNLQKSQSSSGVGERHIEASRQTLIEQLSSEISSIQTSRQGISLSNQMNEQENNSSTLKANKQDCKSTDQTNSAQGSSPDKEQIETIQKEIELMKKRWKEEEENTEKVVRQILNERTVLKKALEEEKALHTDTITELKKALEEEKRQRLALKTQIESIIVSKINDITQQNKHSDIEGKINDRINEIENKHGALEQYTDEMQQYMKYATGCFREIQPLVRSNRVFNRCFKELNTNREFKKRPRDSGGFI